MLNQVPGPGQARYDANRLRHDRGAEGGHVAPHRDAVEDDRAVAALFAEVSLGINSIENLKNHLRFSLRFRTLSKR